MSNKNKIKALILIFCFTNILCFANFQDNVKNGPQLTFDKEGQDYGRVHVNDVPSDNIFRTDISFSNTGNEPLIIDSVRVCCNVTLKEWPKEPIMPGGKGIIKIELKIHQRVPHRINRSVLVLSNCRDEPTYRYRLVGMLIDR